MFRVLLINLNIQTYTHTWHALRTKWMLSSLEQQCAHAAHFRLFFNKDFKVLIDDGDS